MESAEIAALIVQPEARELVPVPNAPRLSNASGELLREILIVDENGDRRAIQVPVERPLTICLDSRELITLMTLGAGAEWLVLGYLHNQQLVSDVTRLESISVDWSTATAMVKTRPGAEGRPLVAPGQPVGIACGLGTVFGDVMRGTATASVAASAADLHSTRTEAAEATGPHSVRGARITRSILLAVLENMRQYDAIHRAAGSVHSCALFRGADLWVSVEDVSRHNGLDIVTGWMALHGVPGGDKILFTTGRLTGEMVMKAAHNGIPCMISRNGVTAIGHDLATKLGMTLFGRAAKGRFLCYTGVEHFDPES